MASPNNSTMMISSNSIVGGLAINSQPFNATRFRFNLLKLMDSYDRSATTTNSNTKYVCPFDGMSSFSSICRTPMLCDWIDCWKIKLDGESNTAILILAN